MVSKWIFFDIGSTLVDETEAYDHRARDMINGSGITFKEFDDVRIMLAKQGLDGNSAAIEYFGLNKTPWHLEDKKLYSDAADTLKALHNKGYRLGVIANQNLGTASRLEKWRIREYFDAIIASAEIGYAKPDKRIFEKAFELAGCKADDTIMVGDRLDNDMIPAKALGMKTIWMRKGLAKYQDISFGKNIVDYSVNELSDLLDIL